MQKKYYNIIKFYSVGNISLCELFLIKWDDNDDYFLEPLLYSVDVFYLDSLAKRNVIIINVN